MTVTTTLTKPFEGIEYNNKSAEFEKELANSKNNADFRIITTNGKKVYMANNKTNEYKWYSDKEYQVIRKQFNVVTDF